MGSFVNFKDLGEAQALAGNGGSLLGNLPLCWQSSIYSLTFDELQNNFTGLRKDFGSMNMDELLKSIWTAEETQVANTAVVDGERSVPSGTSLQRQGSLTLPRTLSQKTVDEVWKDLLENSDGALDGNRSSREVNLHQRQRTLGEMTLEEFLSRAGVVREEAKATPSGFYGESSLSNNIDYSLGFQHLGQNAVAPINGLTENNRSVSNQLPSVAFNSIGIRPYQQQTHAQVPQQHTLFPKQMNMAFAAPMRSLHNNARLVNPGTRGAIRVTANKIGLNDGNGQRAGGIDMTGFRSAGTKVAVESAVKQGAVDVDTSSLSPSPYGYGQASRGRKSKSTLDKVVERRHKRMIKNRESAARSRARKQAYTLELEAEIAKLKGINEELQKKQAEITTMEKNQIQEKMGWQRRQLCLRRTLTGPW